MREERNAKRRRALLAALALLLVVSGATYAGVNAAATKPDIQFQISPAGQSIERGRTKTYTVTVTSTGGFAGTVSLSVIGLPRSATANLVPAAPTLTASGAGSSATSVLSLTTSSTTVIGASTFKVTGTSGEVSGSITARLTVHAPQPSALTTPGTTKVDTHAVIPGGAGQDGAGVTPSASTSVTLDPNTTGKTFTISGNLSGLLAPGRTLPLQLSLTNPNKKSLTVRHLSVTLQSVSQTSFAISLGRQCNLGDYAVIQFGGDYPLVLPGLATMSLSQLGVSADRWPQIELSNRPVNQDGCKGATLSLSYSGSGQGV